MKEKLTFFLLMFMFIANAQTPKGRVGINTDNPEATLDISRVSTLPAHIPQGMLLPKFTSGQRATFQNVEKGTLIFNTTKGCVEMYSGNVINMSGTVQTDTYYWKCLSSASVKVKVEAAGFEGVYLAGLPMNSNNKVKFKITNNTSTPLNGLDFSQALDIQNGTGSTVVVKTTSPAQNSSVNIPANGSVTLIYELTGTPVGGALFVAFSYPSLYADQTQPVDKLAVTNAGWEGMYIEDWAMTPTTGNKVKFRVHNSSITATLSALNFTNPPTIQNASGGNVVALANSTYASVSIPPSGSQLLEYELSGTTPKAGTLSATFTHTLTDTSIQTTNVGKLVAVGDGYVGNYVAGNNIAVGSTGNKVKFKLTNTSSLAITNIDLSNAVSLVNAAGGTMTVPSGQNTSVSIPAGGSITVEYVLVGTPIGASLKADFNYRNTQADQVVPIQNIIPMVKEYSGLYFKNYATTSDNKVKFEIYNSTTTAFNNLNLSNAVTISGAGVGTLQLQSGQNTNVTIAPGSSVVVEYPFVVGGLPASGDIVATFSHLGTSVSQGIGVSEVVGVGFSGEYLAGQVMNTANTTNFKVTNTGATYPTNTMNLSNAVTMQNPTGGTVSVKSGQYTSLVIPRGNSTTLFYALENTPVAGNLVATFLNVSQTKVVTKGLATIPSKTEIIAYSVIHDGVVNYQGRMNNTTYSMKVMIPYTNGKGSYDAFTSAPITVTGQGGDTNTMVLSIPAGTFTTTNGEIEATIIIGGADNEFLVTALQKGQTQTIASFPITFAGNTFGVTIQSYGGVPDRKYYEKTNGKYEHKFVYQPITVDGKVWLSNNLGADYAKIRSNNSHQDVTKVAASLTDYRAYGSRFQWQRPADGHELINWTNSTSGTPVYGTTNSLSSSWSPATNQFIINQNPGMFSNQAWVNDATVAAGPHNLWQGSNAAHNPCPVGYHIPTSTEIPLNRYDIETNNPLYLTGSYIDGKTGQIYKLNSVVGKDYPHAVFWTSEKHTTRNDTARMALYYDPYKYFSTTGTTLVRLPYGSLSDGLPVRCIKD